MTIDRFGRVDGTFNAAASLTDSLLEQATRLKNVFRDTITSTRNDPDRSAGVVLGNTITRSAFSAAEKVVDVCINVIENQKVQDARLAQLDERLKQLEAKSAAPKNPQP